MIRRPRLAGAVAAVALLVSLLPAPQPAAAGLPPDAGTPTSSGVGVISAGSDNTCALGQGGYILCWGADGHGESTPPTGVYVSVSAGAGFACAIKSDGTLACWGDNSDGQASPPAGTYVAVSAGALHACAIKTDGTLVCWGYSPNGEASPPAGTFVAVSAGLTHSCAIKTDGTIACWGLNANGEATPPAGTFLAVAASGSFEGGFSCALAIDRTISCWGYNSTGQTSAPAGHYRTISTGVAYACALDMSGLAHCWGDNTDHQIEADDRPMVGLSAGAAHACGLLAAGTVTCWGDGDDYAGWALRLPSTTFSSIRVGVGTTGTCALTATGRSVCWGGPELLSSFSSRTLIAMSVSHDHACGIVADGANAGVVYCWGQNSAGDAVAPPGSFEAVSAGYDFTCGLEMNGTIACWGSNAYGQSSPAAGSYRSLSAGGYHACAITAAGSVVCWGRDSYGQATPPSGTFRSISAGGFHTCGVKTDGTLACWGYDNSGQATAPSGTFRAVTSGAYHTCGIKTNGTLACWGYNTSGQATPPTGTFTALAAGDTHTCALRANGLLTCFGDDTYGQSSTPITSLMVSGLASPCTAGAGGTLTVRALDVFGSTAANYAGTVHFTSTDRLAALPADYTFAPGEGGVHTFSVTLKTAGQQAIRARDTVNGWITGLQQPIVVNPGAASRLIVSGSSPMTAGVAGTLTVRAVDAYGNTVPNYGGRVHFTSTDPRAVLPADYQFYPGSGSHTFSLTFKTAGAQAVRARDTVTSTITGVQDHVRVNPSAATTLVVSGIADPYAAGNHDTFTVTAKDAYGNTAIDYRGHIHFTTTDRNAMLPFDYSFTWEDAGTHAFTVTLRTAGEQAVRARDTEISSITGIQEHITVLT